MSLKRINITIDQKLHKEIQERGLNLSGLVRERLEDYFSSNTITLSVSKQVKDRYDKIMSLTNSTDKEFMPFLEEALNSYLLFKKEKIDGEITALLEEKKK